MLSLWTLLFGILLRTMAQPDDDRGAVPDADRMMFRLAVRSCGGFHCRNNLPTNATVLRIASAIMPDTGAVRRRTCLRQLLDHQDDAR